MHPIFPLFFQDAHSTEAPTSAMAELLSRCKALPSVVPDFPQRMSYANAILELFFFSLSIFEI